MKTSHSSVFFQLMQPISSALMDHTSVLRVSDQRSRSLTANCGKVSKLCCCLFGCDFQWFHQVPTCWIILTPYPLAMPRCNTSANSDLCMVSQGISLIRLNYSNITTCTAHSVTSTQHHSNVTVMLHHSSTLTLSTALMMIQLPQVHTE